MATPFQRFGSGESIESSVQLLVEGNDQRNFFEALVEHLQLPEVQIRNFGGVNELRNYLAALVNMARFSAVRQVGIVRDAETSAASAFARVQSALRNASLAVPDQPAKLASGKPNISVLALPDGADSGMLGTLLCETFAGTPVDRCIDELFVCVSPLLPNEPKRPEKARCHAWLATKPDPHLSVGVAANGFAAFGSNGPYAESAIANTESPAIIVGRKGSYGKVSWSYEKCFASDTPFFVDGGTCSQDLRWLYWFLQALQLDEGTEEAAVPGLNREALLNRRLAVPSRAKQRSVANYVYRETARLDDIMERMKVSMRLLRERRAAVIAAAVAGEIDVDAYTGDVA